MVKTRTLKIFLATDSPLLGGVVTYIREMAIRLHEKGVAVAVGIRQKENLKPILDTIRQKGIPITSPFDTSFYRQGYLPVITGFGPFSYKHFFTHYRESIIIVHDQVDIYYPWPFQGLYRVGYKLLQIPNLQKARSLITVSDWTRKFLVSYYKLDPDRVFVVKNGVDITRFKPVTDPQLRPHIRRKLGLDNPQKPLVLIPGRLSPEKNPLIPLLVAKMRPDIQFAYVGSGELEKALKNLARILKLRNVLFLGKRYDMEEIYSSADVMLQPTLGENQSLVTLEAMASGLPVITSPIPSQEELIRHLKTGILTPLNPKEISFWLDYALKDGGTLGAEARRYIERHHTLDLTVNNFILTLSQIKDTINS